MCVCVCVCVCVCARACVCACVAVISGPGLLCAVFADVHVYMPTQSPQIWTFCLVIRDAVKLRVMLNTLINEEKTHSITTVRLDVLKTRLIS